VRAILVLQVAVIVGLSLWIYNEYVSNAYLRTYLASLLQGQGSIITVMSLGGFIATVLVGILLKAGSVFGDIERLSERVGDQADAPEARQDRSVPMPVLKVVEPEPGDEISRLHSSLRRWNERPK
jgi:hypothetical protein